MKKIIILSFVFLTSCGLSRNEKENIAAVTCSIMSETLNMDAAIRIREINNARQKIGEEPYLSGDAKIAESLKWGICKELVLNDNYDKTLESRVHAPIVKEEYFKNGNLRSRKNYQAEVYGAKEHGLHETYYENGQLKSKENYKEGEPHGSFFSYYENGQLEFKENYKEGELHGSVFSYYENGQLRGKVTFSNGNLSGIMQGYYDSGQLRLKESFKDDEPHGNLFYYHENGQISRKAKYTHGKRDGVTLVYSENGQLQTKDNYIDGYLVSRESYDNNGNIRETLNFEDVKWEWTFDELMVKGEEVYNISCAGCHSINGEGVPGVFPALKDSVIALGPVVEHLRVVVDGIPGTAMQSFADQLSEVEIAAVIHYERNAWGNDMGDITQPIDVLNYMQAE